MKPRYLLAIAALLGALLLLAAGLSLWSRELLRGLAYDGVRTVRVGRHLVTIETQSSTLAGGEDGPARIIVAAGDGAAVLDSSFNRDLYLDIRPAYISWRDVDDAHGLDLVIWKPLDHDFIATDYISSGDGRLYTLEPPLERDTAIPSLFAWREE